MVAKHPLSLPGIYRITRISDGKVYIGQARKVSQRFASHRRELDLGRHKNWPLQEAWNEDGPEGFVWDIVCQPIAGHDPEIMTLLEFEVLCNYPDHFNLNEPIQAYLGAHPSTREKLSHFHKALWEDPAFQAKVSEGHARRLADPEHRERHRQAMVAFNATPEGQEVRSRIAKEYWSRDGTREQRGRKTKAHWEDPAHREKQRESRKASWQDPEKRLRRTTAIKESWDRLSPEQRAERQAKMRAGKSREVRREAVLRSWETRKANGSREKQPALFSDIDAWWKDRLGEE